MLLVLTSSAGLQSAYGSSGAQAIQTKLAQLGAARRDLLVQVLGLSADPNTLYSEMKSALGERQLGVAQLQDGILIIGDQRVFPSFTVTNPVGDRTVDPDAMVLTDNPFGQLDWQQADQVLLPPIPVGRIAAGVDQPAGALCALIANLSSRQSGRTGYVEITSRQWQNASSSVLSAFAPSARVIVSPDQRVDAGNASTLDCKYLYCNLHGFLNSAPWCGYDDSLSMPVPALSPDAFQAAFVGGTVVFTEACYGLATSGKRTGASNALSLLAAGAAAVIGSTGLAFGTADPRGQSLIDADVMARNFFNISAGGGSTIGQSLLAARQALRGTGSGDDLFLRKTLLEFQILGDPSYVPA